MTVGMGVDVGVPVGRGEGVALGTSVAVGVRVGAGEVGMGRPHAEMSVLPARAASALRKWRRVNMVIVIR